MRPTNPIISVLMPVYNAERYVAEAVESILAQTFADFEFLIIDDGSTDGSLEILRSLAQRDSRINLVSRPNTGYPVALVEMLARARGEFIARMDSDDVAMPQRFEKQIAFLRDNPDHVLVGSRVVVIDSDGDELCEMGARCGHDELVRGLLQSEGQLIYHPSILVRRSAMEQVGGYRVEYFPVEDLDLFLRLADVGRLANLPEPLLRYREHADKVGLVHRRKQLEKIQEIVAEASARFNVSPPLTPPPPGAADAAPAECTLPEVYRKWGWWALMAGRRRAARKYGWRALRQDPCSAASWRLMACALRGR